MLTKQILLIILGVNGLLLLLNSFYLQQQPLFYNKGIIISEIAIFKIVDDQSFLTAQKGVDFEPDENKTPEETNSEAENKESLEELMMNAKLSTNLSTLLNADLLQQLGFYKEMPAEFYNYKDGGKLLNHLLYISIKHNHQYCKQADAYNILHPENVFNTMNFITDYSGEG